MRVIKSWTKFKPRSENSELNYKGIAVILDDRLAAPSNGYGTPLKVKEKRFKTKIQACRWIDFLKKSVRSDSNLYPTVSGDRNAQ